MSVREAAKGGEARGKHTVLVVERKLSLNLCAL